MVVGLHTTSSKVFDEDLESFNKITKQLYNKSDTYFQLKKSKYALKNISIQYRIDGKDWIDPDLFLVYAKESKTNRLINTRLDQYTPKVKLILLFMMEKVDLKCREVIAKEAAFLSKTEVNLESTNSNELLSIMKENVSESLAKFERQGSNWRFRSVLSLDLHTVKYEPLGGSSYIPLPGFLAAMKEL